VRLRQGQAEADLLSARVRRQRTIVVELVPSFEPRAAMTMSTITRIAAMTITVHAVGLSETFVVVVDVLVLVLVVGAVAGTVWFCCVVVDELDESGGAVYVSDAMV